MPKWFTSRLTAFAWGQAMSFIGLFSPEFRQAILRDACRAELEKQRQRLLRGSLRVQREQADEVKP